MDVVSVAIIGKALDGLAIRQTYLAQNIANVNTQDYTPVKVSFEDNLKAAAAQSMQHVSQVEPKVDSQVSTDVSNAMRLDLELAESSKTALRYSALIDVLSRQMSLTRTILGGGQ